MTKCGETYVADRAPRRLRGGAKAGGGGAVPSAVLHTRHAAGTALHRTVLSCRVGRRVTYATQLRRCWSTQDRARADHVPTVRPRPRAPLSARKIICAKNKIQKHNFTDSGLPQRNVCTSNTKSAHDTPYGVPAKRARLRTDARATSLQTHCQKHTRKIASSSTTQTVQ